MVIFRSEEGEGKYVKEFRTPQTGRAGIVLRDWEEGNEGEENMAREDDWAPRLAQSRDPYSGNE
jgi:hypothetical protein